MRKHIRQAEKVSIELWRLGAAVICPGKNTEWFDGAALDEVWLKGDLEMVRRCDAVVMAPNWLTSVGARGEKDFALKHNKRVFYWPEDRRKIERFLRD